jgi:hypothetical protein
MFKPNKAGAGHDAQPFYRYPKNYQTALGTKPMEVFHTLLGFSDGGELFNCDTIEHEGQFWLVPEWLEAPELGMTRPARIIPLAKLRHQKMGPNYPQRFLLNDPMPRDVFEGRAPPQLAEQFGVITEPQGIVIHFPASGIH